MPRPPLLAALALACGTPSAPVDDGELQALRDRVATLEARTAVLPCAPQEQIRATPDGTLTCVAPAPTFDPATLADATASTSPVGWQDLEDVPPDLLDGDDDSFAGFTCPDDQVAVAQGGDRWACAPRLHAEDFAPATLRCTPPELLVGVEDGAAVCADTVPLDGFAVDGVGPQGVVFPLLTTSGGVDDFVLAVGGDVSARTWSVGEGSVRAQHLAGTGYVARDADASPDLALHPAVQGVLKAAFVEVSGMVETWEAGARTPVPFRVTGALVPEGGGGRPAVQHVVSSFPGLRAPSLTASFFCVDGHGDVVLRSTTASGCINATGFWGVWVAFPRPATAVPQGTTLHAVWHARVIADAGSPVPWTAEAFDD